MDWDVEAIGKIAAVASAVGASVGGLIAWLVNWWWKVRELRDCIMVRYGALTYEEMPGFSMHVISRRAHKMVLADYGFVLRDGRLVSMPVHWEQQVGEPNNDAWSGSTTLNGLNESFQLRAELRDDGIVGAYARTSTQRRPTVDFRHWEPLPLHEQIRIRFQLRWMRLRFW